MTKIVNDLYQYNRITEEDYTQAQRELTYFFKEAPPFDENSLDEIDESDIEEFLNSESHQQKESEPFIEEETEEIPNIESNNPETIEGAENSESSI